MYIVADIVHNKLGTCLHAETYEEAVELGANLLDEECIGPDGEWTYTSFSKKEAVEKLALDGVFHDPNDEWAINIGSFAN